MELLFIINNKDFFFLPVGFAIVFVCSIPVLSPVKRTLNISFYSSVMQGLPFTGITSLTLEIFILPVSVVAVFLP